ncbi:MAG: GTPase [archaeon]
MPANVSIDFIKAQEKFENAKTDSEKLAALIEMKSKAPKHKGGENLRAELSKKLAQLKSKMERQRKSPAKKGSAPSLHVKKEGIGQAILVGMPNSGKSFLLNKLTNVNVEVRDYPFTTTKPEVGMMNYNEAGVQVVEAPAIIEGSAKGKANGTQILSVVRNSDAIVFVLEDGVAEEQLRILLNELNKVNVKVSESKPLIDVKVSEFPGINISGEKFLKVKREELIDFLKGLGYFKANVILNEATTLEKVAEVLDARIVYKKSLIILTKWKEKKKNRKFRNLNNKVMDFVYLEEDNLDELKEKIFLLLDRILIFTKKPGEEVDFSEPMVLDKGSTVEGVARKLHKDFARNLKFVKVWGSSKFPGQRVSKKYELKNNDVIEIYS